MIQDATGLFADDGATMLADLAQLTPEPAGLESLLRSLGYNTQPFGSGLYASHRTGHSNSPVLLLPLYTRASLSVRKRLLIGRQINRSATVAAALAALRSVGRRPALLFMLEQAPAPDGITPSQIISLEGGVVPRIWRHCFGRLDILARITGQRSHPGLSNTAINAIETAVPVLQALLRLKADIQLRAAQRGQFADSPLQSRLTISAAHGGSRGSSLPTVFDILLSRRYEPAEQLEAVLDEMNSVISSAATRSLGVEVAVVDHERPVPDPDAASRSREERALATGWGWPQVPFCTTSRLIPGSTVLGGLERADHDAEADDAFTTLDDMAALSRTLRALWLDAEMGNEPAP